jgi:hypothetical protein
MMNLKDLEGSDHDLIQVLCRQLLGGAEENYEKPQSGWSVSRPRFEPKSS